MKLTPEDYKRFLVRLEAHLARKFPTTVPGSGKVTAAGGAISEIAFEVFDATYREHRSTSAQAGSFRTLAIQTTRKAQAQMRIHQRLAFITSNYAKFRTRLERRLNRKFPRFSASGGSASLEGRGIGDIASDVIAHIVSEVLAGKESVNTFTGVAHRVARKAQSQVERHERRSDIHRRNRDDAISRYTRRVVLPAAYAMILIASGLGIAKLYRSQNDLVEQVAMLEASLQAQPAAISTKFTTMIEEIQEQRSLLRDELDEMRASDLDLASAREQTHAAEMASVREAIAGYHSPEASINAMREEMRESLSLQQRLSKHIESLESSYAQQAARIDTLRLSTEPFTKQPSGTTDPVTYPALELGRVLRELFNEAREVLNPDPVSSESKDFDWAPEVRDEPTSPYLDVLKKAPRPERQVIDWNPPSPGTVSPASERFIKESPLAEDLVGAAKELDSHAN